MYILDNLLKRTPDERSIVPIYFLEGILCHMEGRRDFNCSDFQGQQNSWKLLHIQIFAELPNGARPEPQVVPLACLPPSFIYGAGIGRAGRPG